jgi:hypothetical protein
MDNAAKLLKAWIAAQSKDDQDAGKVATEPGTDRK